MFCQLSTKLDWIYDSFYLPNKDYFYFLRDGFNRVQNDLIVAYWNNSISMHQQRYVIKTLFSNTNTTVAPQLQPFGSYELKLFIKHRFPRTTKSLVLLVQTALHSLRTLNEDVVIFG